MSPLTEYVNIHAGKTAWIFGKGPSLSTFDIDSAGEIRGAINDVVNHIPNCRYAFSNDGVRDWADVYKPHHTLFQPLRGIQSFGAEQPDTFPCKHVIYKDAPYDEYLQNSREQLAECLAIRRGTLGSALQILHIMGITTVHLVGIDGGKVHAPGYQWRTRLRNDHAQEYNGIKSDAIETAQILGLKLIFHNPDNTMTENGTVKIKVIRTCFVDASPVDIGDILTVAPHKASELIGLNIAVPFDAPEKTGRETAMLTATKETAALKPASKKKASKR